MIKYDDEELLVMSPEYGLVLKCEEVTHTSNFFKKKEKKERQNETSVDGTGLQRLTFKYGDSGQK